MIAGVRASRGSDRAGNGRIDQLSAKLVGLDVALEVKFDAANARVDVVSEQLGGELKNAG